MSLFFTDARGVLQCEPLAKLAWLDHGFSTRHSAGWLAGAQLASLKQIHSPHVLTASGPGVQGEGDALVTDRSGLHLGVRTADCLPIVVVDPVRRAVAAIHSGWRGTVGEIAAKSVERMRAEFGSNATDLEVAIGPGIGICCFEVGPEVAEQFGQSGKVHVDLASTLASQLVMAGIPANQIHNSSLCTYCDPDRFWSYRRQGEAAGRMWSGAAILMGR